LTKVRSSRKSKKQEVREHRWDKKGTKEEAMKKNGKVAKWIERSSASLLILMLKARDSILVNSH
jgi:hypothetical protein